VDADAGPEVGPHVQPTEGVDPSVRRRRALQRSVTDMVASMAAIIAFVVVIVLLVPRPNATPPLQVDVTGAAAAARSQVAFVPAVPVGLPGWRATSVGVRNSQDAILTWHVGYLTAAGRYASIEQAARPGGQWENILDSGGTPRASQTIDGRTWYQFYTGVRDVTALINRGEGDTTMVTSKGGGLADATVLARSIPASSL
jgi:Protein of unknown function (DUF4245)